MSAFTIITPVVLAILVAVRACLFFRARTRDAELSTKAGEMQRRKETAAAKEQALTAERTAKIQAVQEEQRAYERAVTAQKAVASAAVAVPSSAAVTVPIRSAEEVAPMSTAAAQPSPASQGSSSMVLPIAASAVPDAARHVAAHHVVHLDAISLPAVEDQQR